MKGKTKVTEFKQKVRFDNPAGVKRFLGRVLNEMNEDKISTDKARCMGYLCGVMLKTFEVSDFEKRIEELELGLLNEAK